MIRKLRDNETDLRVSTKAVIDSLEVIAKASDDAVARRAKIIPISASRKSRPRFALREITNPDLRPDPAARAEGDRQLRLLEARLPQSEKSGFIRFVRGKRRA